MTDAFEDDAFEDSFEGDAAIALLSAHARLQALLRRKDFPGAERHETACTLHLVTMALRRGGYLESYD